MNRAVLTLNAFGPTPEEVILFLLRSSLSKLGNPLNASSGMEVMELPRTCIVCVRCVYKKIHLNMWRGMCTYVHVCVHRVDVCMDIKRALSEERAGLLEQGGLSVLYTNSCSRNYDSLEIF